VAPALETHGGDEALDLGSLGIGLGILLLRTLHLPPNDILPNIILLPQVKKAPNLRRPLRAEPLRQHIVRQPGDLPFALLHDDQAEDGDVWADDAPADGLALALAVAAGAEAGVPFGEEEAHAVGEEDALFHGEALLVVPAGDAEEVAFPFVAEGVAGDFLGYFFVVEDADSSFVVDVEELLGPCRGVSNIELHTEILVLLVGQRVKTSWDGGEC